MARLGVQAESSWLDGESEARGSNRRLERVKRSEARRLRRQLAVGRSAACDGGSGGSERWVRRRDEDRLSSLEAAADALILCRAAHARNVRMAATAAPLQQPSHARGAATAVRWPLFDRRRAIDSWQREADQQLPYERQQGREWQRWAEQHERDTRRREEDRESAGKRQSRRPSEVSRTAAPAPLVAAAGAGGDSSAALSGSARTTDRRLSKAHRAAVKQARALGKGQQRQQRTFKQRRPTQATCGPKHADTFHTPREEEEGRGVTQHERDAKLRERLVQQLIRNTMEGGDTAAQGMGGSTSDCSIQDSSRKWRTSSNSNNHNSITNSGGQCGDTRERYLEQEEERLQTAVRGREDTDEAATTTAQLSRQLHTATAEETAVRRQQVNRQPPQPTAAQQQQQQQEGQQLVRSASRGERSAMEASITGGHSGERVVIDGQLNVHYLSQQLVTRHFHIAQTDISRSRLSATSRFPPLSATRRTSTVTSLCPPLQSSPSPSLAAIDRSELTSERLSGVDPTRGRSSSSLAVRFASLLALEQRMSQPRSAAIRPSSAFATAVSISLWQQPHVTTRIHQPPHFCDIADSTMDTHTGSGSSGGVTTDPLQSAQLKEKRRQKVEAVRQQQYVATTSATTTASELLNQIVAQHDLGCDMEQCEHESNCVSEPGGQLLLPSILPPHVVSTVAASRASRQQQGRRRSNRRRSSVLMEEWRALEDDVALRQWRTSGTLHDKWTEVVGKWQRGEPMSGLQHCTPLG